MGAGGGEVGEAEKGSEPGRPALGAHSGSAATEKPFLNCLHAWCGRRIHIALPPSPTPRVDALYLQKVCPHQVDRNRISFLAWGLLKVIFSPCFLFCPAAVLSLRRVMLTELSTLWTDQVASSRGPWAYWIKGKPSAWSTSPAVSWCLPSALAADPTTYLQLNRLLGMRFLFHFIFY